MTQTVEDIILDHDKRGMLAIQPHLPTDFCRQAARGSSSTIRGTR